MSIRVMIVDDEPLSRDELRYLIQKHEDFEVCGEAGSAVEAIKLYLQARPDVVFLDILMQDMDGLLVAKQWQQQKSPPLVVFTTAFDRHAIDAFAVNAVDYLLKPFDERRFLDTLDRLRAKLHGDQLSLSGAKGYRNEEEPKYKVSKLIVEEDGKAVLLDPEDVVYAYREERKVYIKTKDRVFSTSYSLQDLSEKLERFPFFRTHRSYLVNLNMIAEITPWFNGAYNLQMKDVKKSVVPVSRNYVRDLMKKLEL